MTLHVLSGLGFMIVMKCDDSVSVKRYGQFVVYCVLSTFDFEYLKYDIVISGQGMTSKAIICIEST